MNFLAHLRVGGDSEDDMVGSVLGDFVKGRVPDSLPAALRRGVLLHRRVDRFTDDHPVCRRSRQRLGPRRRRVAGIVVDLCYDHLLARHWERWAEEPLADFAARAYRVLDRRRGHQPEAMRRVAAAMARGDWLGSYRELAGLAVALDRVALRFRRPTNLAGAVVDVERAYAGLERDFEAFFPELLAFASRTRRRLARE